jgi:hypothetical protein
MILTKSEFAARAGIKSKDLSVYIRRGKITLTGDRIEDTDPDNALFLQRREAMGKSSSMPTKDRKQKAPGDKKKSDVSTKRAKKSRSNNLVTENLKLKNAKYQEEIGLLRAKKSKLNEELIPREFVVHLVVAQSEGLKTSWMSATETFVSQFAGANQMTREETVHWRKELTGIINEAIKEGVAEAKKNLRRIAREYANKKGQGERG